MAKSFQRSDQLGSVSIPFREMLTRLLISQLFLHVPDQVLEKIFAFSTAFACTGRIHNLLQSVRSVPNGILDHTICDIAAMTRFFTAIQNTAPPQNIDLCVYHIMPWNALQQCF